MGNTARHCDYDDDDYDVAKVEENTLTRTASEAGNFAT